MGIIIVGAGYCGVRVAHDLKAYSERSKTSYELYSDPPDILEQIIDNLRRIIAGQYVRIADRLQLSLVDSGTKKHIGLTVKAIKSPSDLDSIKAVFPGLVRNIRNRRGHSLFLTSFSLSGTTGTGLAQALVKESKVGRNGTLGRDIAVGVVPRSNIKLGLNDLALVYDDLRTYAFGRWMTKYFGGGLEGGIESIWLFSNDLERCILEDADEEIVKLDDGGNVTLATINAFIAQSVASVANMTALCGDRTREKVQSWITDLKAPFVSGVAGYRAGEGDDPGFIVRKLLAGGLTNIEGHSEAAATQGLSVPIAENDLIRLANILNDDRVATDQIIQSRFRSYNAKYGPVEFESAEKVLVLYRRPQGSSTRTAELLKICCEKVFPSANIEVIPNSERISSHRLTILIGRGHVEWVARSMRDYINLAWGNGSAPKHHVALEALTGSSLFEEPLLDKVLNEKEKHYFREFEEESPLERFTVVTALRELHSINQRSERLCEIQEDDEPIDFRAALEHLTAVALKSMPVDKVPAESSDKGIESAQPKKTVKKKIPRKTTKRVPKKRATTPKTIKTKTTRKPATGKATKTTVKKKATQKEAAKKKVTGKKPLAKTATKKAAKETTTTKKTDRKKATSKKPITKNTTKKKEAKRTSTKKKRASTTASFTERIPRVKKKKK